MSVWQVFRRDSGWRYFKFVNVRTSLHCSLCTARRLHKRSCAGGRVSSPSAGLTPRQQTVPGRDLGKGPRPP